MLSTTKSVYIQDQDDMSSDEGCQELTVETTDGGAGHFLVISTKRWAMDPSGVRLLIKRLKAQLAWADRMAKDNDEEA